MSSPIANRTQLAALQGVNLSTVDNWVRAGCPVVQRGGRGTEWQFDSAAITKWRLDQQRTELGGDEKVNEGKLRMRRVVAETKQAELALAKELGLVAPIEQMERTLAKVFAEIRAGMRNIPGRTVSMLIGETDERRFKQVLLQEIDQVLKSLESMDLTAMDADEPGDDDEAE